MRAALHRCRSAITVAPLLVLLAAPGPGPGCAGSVSFSEVDPFGPVASAVWPQASYRGGTHDLVILSETPALCSKLQDDLQAYDDLLYDYAHHDDPCAAAPDFYGEVADLTAPYQRPGRSQMTIEVWGADGPGMPLIEGSWNHEGDHVLEVWVDHFRENPALVAQRLWSDGACSTDFEAMEEAVDRWYLASGELTLELPSERRLKGTLTGELADEMGEPAGSADAQFTARACPVELDSDSLYLFSF